MPVVVADVARLQVAPQELPNSGESGYPKVRYGVAFRGLGSYFIGNFMASTRSPLFGAKCSLGYRPNAVVKRVISACHALRIKRFALGVVQQNIFKKKQPLGGGCGRGCLY